MANDIRDSREAKNIFPVEASGGIVGGALVCFSLAGLVWILPAKNLVFLWCLFTLLALPIFMLLRAKYRYALKSKTFVGGSRNRLAPLAEDVDIVRSEPLLKNMAIFYLILLFLVISHDFLFLSEMRQTFAQRFGQAWLPERLSAFLGLFKGISNAVTFILQITVAGFFLRHLGTVRSMYVLPTVLIAVFGLMILQGLIPLVRPELISFYAFFGSAFFMQATLSVGGRIAVFDSIFSPNFQIFQQPEQRHTRTRQAVPGEPHQAFYIYLVGLFVMFITNRIPPVANHRLLILLALFILLQAMRLK